MAPSQSGDSSSDDPKMPFQGLGAQHEKGFFSTGMGPLQRQLRKGEYGLFKYSPMFESDFVQISKQGGPIEIHNQEQIVTVGLTASSPLLLIPDVLLLARPLHRSEALWRGTKLRPGRQVTYELSRLFPLRLVKISVHNAERQQLRFKLASGRTFYLQLCPESYKREELFGAWARMIQLLWPPSETKSERKELDRIRSASPPRPAAPSPKPTAASMAAWSDFAVTKSLVEDKGKRKPSKGKAPATEAAPPPRAEEEAELLSPVPSQSCELEEASEEEPVERSPSRRSQVAEKGRPGSSPPSRRCHPEAQQASLSHQILLLGQSKGEEACHQIPVQGEEAVNKVKRRCPKRRSLYPTLWLQ
ncbi:UNVERIFIED_CONTAM: hypothetical protein K2H54_056282 [Gekko kuhli]